jgi:lauroyl/myristoyl acyltransferase
MPINPRNLINSAYGIRLALWMGRTMPYKTGRRLARAVGDWIASHREWEMVRAVRANRWVVSGETLQGVELDQAVRATFRHTADSLFTLYHYFQNIEAMLRLVHLDPPTEALLHRPKYEQRGIVLVGLHRGNFDFVLQGAGMLKLEAFLLTLPELAGGYQLQYELRRRTGMNLVPATLSNVRQAVEYLRAGGMVVTGIDRPENGMSYQPMFFNRPSALPVHHILLALKAKVPVQIACSLLEPDGRYRCSFSEPIEMQPYADHCEI